MLELGIEELEETTITCADLQPYDVLVFGEVHTLRGDYDGVVCMVQGVDEGHIYVWQHAVSSLPFCYPRAWFDALLAKDGPEYYRSGAAAEAAWNKGLRSWMKKGGR